VSLPPPPERQWAWFFDVDGTLARLESRPDAVVIDEPTRRNLAALGVLAGGAVAVVSGRSIADVDALFGGAVAAVAGQHGNERRRADRATVSQVERPPALDHASRDLRAFESDHAGIVVEDKGLSLAIHFRLAPALEETVGERVRALGPLLGADFLVQGGKSLLEIVPAGRNKGTAVTDFMREAPFRGRTPAFLGDDVTDELAFMTVNQLGGHSIKVGAGDTIARYRLDDVDAVQRWLAQLLAPESPGSRERR
jgi:trehalose 6-phosphate phosphatase